MNDVNDEVMGSKAPTVARLVKHTWEASHSFSTDDLQSFLVSSLDHPLIWENPQNGTPAVASVTQEPRPETTLRKLLAQDKPPLSRIKSAKDYAKACLLNPESSMPPEVATVLYFLCIAVALARHQARISSLSNEALSQGFAWASAVEWVDADTRRWLNEGQHSL
jgi:hypothetical protein